MSWQRKVVATELRKILAYRSDFWVNFIGQTLVQLFIARALWTAVFEARGVTSMHGMDLATLTLYYLLAPVTMKALMGENIGFLARDIYDGGLNRYVVWPLPPLGYKLLTYLTHAGFYILQIGLLYSIGRLWLNPQPVAAVELVRLLMGMGYLLLATVAYFCLMSVCEMVSFWADNTWSLGVMVRFTAAFLGGAHLPLDFFPAAVREGLQWLPFNAMVGVPVNLILGRATFAEAGHGLLVLVIWMPLMAGTVWLTWRRGSLRYSGVGM